MKAAQIDPTAAGASALLGEDAFHVSNGVTQARFPYGDVELIRLSYRPRSFDYHVFRLDIRMKDGRTIHLSNATTSPVSLFRPQRRWDQGFRDFATGLARRAAAANPALRLEGGMPAWRFWPGAALALMLLLAFSWQIAEKLTAGAWFPVAVSAGGLAIGLWFLTPFLRRNRPRPLSADSIPSDLLP